MTPGSLARRAARAARDRLGCDIAWRNGWRVFRAHDGSGEMIDPAGVVAARGRPDWLVGQLPRRAGAAPAAGRAVILLHGVGNAFGALGQLDASLRRRGAVVLRPSYDAVAGHFHEAADAMARVIGSLGGFARIDFVAFSMGGLVLRAALAHEAASVTRAAWGRAVLAAVPNRGSRVAAMILDRLPPAQARVARGLIEVEAARLPVPPIPFGLLMADGGRLLEPLFGGPNDTLVATAEMELEGAADRTTLPAIHAYLLRRADAIDRISCFLDMGRFLPDD